MLVVTTLEEFAARHHLHLHRDTSPDGLPQVSLYSLDMRYRYAFARWWRAEDALDLWLGLNPAKGDTERRRRPTLDRCIHWSRSWGAAGLIFGNLFAARHNRPAGLHKTPDPVGPHNDEMLAVLAGVAQRTLVAWGARGNLHGRAAAVVRLFTRPLCLGVTATGQPRHPLYVRGDVAVRPWRVRGRCRRAVSGGA